MSTAAAIRAYRGPAVFSIGLRPFFLFSALWSAIAAPLWVYAFLNGGPVGLAGMSMKCCLATRAGSSSAFC